MVKSQMQKNRNDTPPLVSVVMPFFNRDRYLREAIEGILNQTYNRWELILVDDGSTDKSAEVAQRFAEVDKRITLIRHTNGEFPEVRNTGLAAIRGKYYANNDSDDISHPERLQNQVEFLESNKDFNFVGSSVDIINKEGTVIGKRCFPQDYGQIVRKAIKMCPFCHSSIMMRTEVIRQCGGYSGPYIASEYGLWLELLLKHKACNLPQNLVQYRLTPNQLTSRVRETLLQTAVVQRKFLLKKEYRSLTALIAHLGYYGLAAFPESWVDFLYRKLLLKKS